MKTEQAFARIQELAQEIARLRSILGAVDNFSLNSNDRLTLDRYNEEYRNDFLKEDFHANYSARKFNRISATPIPRMVRAQSSAIAPGLLGA